MRTPPSCAPPSARGPVWLRPAAGCVVLALLGCESSVSLQAEKTLRRVVEEAAYREISEGERTGQAQVLTREDSVGQLGISPQIMQELDAMAGPVSRAQRRVPLGDNLLGTPVRTISVSLERAIQTAVKNNIAVQFARLSPPISEAKIAAAEAAFDWTLFSNTTWNNTDTPRTQVANSTGATTFSGPTVNLQNSVSSTTGLRRTLIGGGRLTVQQELGYADDRSPGQTINPNPASTVAFTMQFEQPLLKGMGSEISQAEIRVARNAERTTVQTFKRDLSKIVADSEKAYWDLVQAREDLVILQRLLERGEATLAQLRARAAFDANQAQIADATARVARRRADLTRGQTSLKSVSDRLKVLMNDPDLPVGSELLLLPVDRPVDEPVRFSLPDSIRQAVLNRPEVQQAILGIDDASIRRMVADNARQPDLTLRLQARMNELQDSFGDSYREITDARYVDFIVGVVLEMPLGGRKAEAEFRQRSLERLQAVVSYRNTVQVVTQEVKASLDKVALNYKLIEQTRASRIAASEVLRVLLVEKDINRGVTPERLDLELNREESLAQAEQDEVRALAEYNAAITDLFQAMGTILERNNVRFVVPMIEDARAR